MFFFLISACHSFFSLLFHEWTILYYPKQYLSIFVAFYLSVLSFWKWDYFNKTYYQMNISQNLEFLGIVNIVVTKILFALYICNNSSYYR